VVSSAPSPVIAAADGVRVRLRVQPRARRDRVDGVVVDADGGAALKVAVTAAPERGEANDAVIALLAGEWGLARSALTLVAGVADRRKVIKLAGDSERLARHLKDWMDGLESRK
jgi:uncharacterized protein YggU (UPF0235/DUF167 family)